MIYYAQPTWLKKTAFFTFGSTFTLQDINELYFNLYQDLGNLNTIQEQKSFYDYLHPFS